MKEYGFLNTVLLVNGVSIEGYDKGDDVITLARRVDSASDVVGADGEMAVGIGADRSGTIVFRLLQTSDSNQFLSGLISIQENGIFVPIFAQFRDTRGGDLGAGSDGYILKPANMVRGVAPNSQEWTIVTERLDMLHLG